MIETDVQTLLSPATKLNNICVFSWCQRLYDLFWNQYGILFRGYYISWFFGTIVKKGETRKVSKTYQIRVRLDPDTPVAFNVMGEIEIENLKKLKDERKSL